MLLPLGVHRENAFLRIPRLLSGLLRREDKPAPADNGGGDNNNNKETAKTTASPTPTQGKNTATDHANTATEQGGLEPDKSRTGTTPTSAHDNKSDGGDDNENDNHKSQDNVKTDAAGNPVITDGNASQWSLIMPTGVNYLSGAPRLAASAATFGALGAAIVLAALC
ncbi:hypothetical protein H4R19_001803 [Coemansia spiralis]|nr:hypothetical protein H4R19_001803 [Coemansia spiralis]